MLLVADAGFGKTTLLRELLAERSPVASLHCSPRVRDPGQLVLDLVAATRAAVPGAVDQLGERLAALAPALDPLAAVREVVAELDALLVEPLVIVVDDAEHLAEAPQAAAVLAELLGGGRAVRVAVASRRPLPLKLAKLQATGRLTELGAADLAFTVDECAAYLQRRWGREPTGDEIETVMTATGGWPLAIALGTARDGAVVRTPAALSAFVEEEVLDRLDSATRAGVLDTSAADAFDASVLAALGHDDALPARAEAAGLQLREVEGDPGWLAYHPLVREVLRARLQRELGPVELRAVHARLAAALAAAGRGPQAIEHWLAAERWPDAVAAMAQEGPGVLRTPLETARRWLATLPAGERGAPTCLLLDGQLAWLDGDHATAIDRWRDAAAGFEATGDAAGAWAARFALTEPLALAGAFDEIVAVAGGFDGELPEAAAMPAAGVGFYATMALAATGRTGEARAMAARLLAQPAGAAMAPMHVAWEAYWLLPAGELDALETALAESVRAFTESDPLNRLPQSLLQQAMLLGDIGRVEEALATWGEAEALALDGRIRHLVDTVRTWRAILLAREHRTAEAEHELSGVAMAPASGWDEHGAELARALVAAQRGDAAAAVRAAERALAIAGPASLLDRHRLAMHAAPVLFEAGLPGDGRALLDATLGLVDQQHPGASGRYLRSLLLAERAALQWAEGDDDAAVDELARCWAEAGDAAPAVVRRTWRLLEQPLWHALEIGALPAEEVLRGVLEARPGSDALLRFTEHPAAAVRRTAVHLLAGSGRPELPRRLSELATDPDPAVRTAAAAAARRIRTAPPPLQISLLGGFRLQRGAWVADDAAWGRRAARRLVRLLLVHRPEPVPEDVLLEAFWPDAADAARHSLQTAVSSARRLLDPPGGSTVLETSGGGYRLRLGERDSVDAERFERAAEAALAATGGERLRLLAAAAELWGGEPLPEEGFADWAAAWRERLVDRYTAVLSALAQGRLDAGELPAATGAAGRLVRRDPLNEAGHRILMRAYARAGRRSRSLRQYLECRHALVESLGVEPATETSELQRRILAGEPV